MGILDFKVGTKTFKTIPPSESEQKRKKKRKKRKKQLKQTATKIKIASNKLGKRVLLSKIRIR